MGFHKKFITNNQIIDLFKQRGINEVIKTYKSEADVIITDSGLSSDILNVIINGTNIKEKTLHIIQKELNNTLKNRI